MSQAREKILNRIRAATTQSKVKPELIRPGIGADLLAQFREKLELGGGELTLADDYQQAAAQIETFIADQQLPASLRLAPALKSMDWDSSLEVSYGKTDGNDLVSVTPAFCAIAETGSVVLLSSADSPTSLNYLPDVHFVIVEQSQLLPHIEDVWVKLRRECDLPRAINIITGPSKTADVEQTLQIGAHGPRQLKVILLADASSPGVRE